MSKKVFRLKKKWIVLLSAAIVISSGVVFRRPIFCKGIETYLGVKMSGYGGWKFNFKNVSLKYNRLDFNEVDLKTKGVGARIHIDKLSAVFEWKKGINFDFRFVVEEPIIEVEKVDSKSEFTLASIMQGPLERHKVDITDGLIKFVDAEGKVDLYFSLDGDHQRRSVGVFYLSETPPGEKDVSAMVKLYQWPKELIVESELKNSRIVWLSRIVNFFQPNCLEDWGNLEGVVSGHSWIGFDQSGLVIQTTANIEVENFSCERKSGEFALTMQDLSLDFSFPSGGKKIEQRETWWQSLALKSKIIGGVARFKDAEWGADFTLSDIDGTLNFSTFKDSNIELKGFLHQGGEVSPIVVSGNPSLVDRDSLDLDMRLFLEPDSLTSTHLNLLISSTGKDSCLVRGQLKELDAPQIKMFQHLIAFAMPEVKDMHFKKGALTCELSLVIADGKLNKLLLENMVANDLELYWASQDLSTTANLLEASAQLDLDVVEKFRFPSWKVKIVDGEMIKARSSDKPIKFSDINLEVFMCRDVFEPSWAKAKYDDVDIDLDVVGFFSEANVKVNLAAPLERVVRFFDAEKDIVKEKFGGCGLAANFNLRRQLGYWDVSGAVNLDVQKDWSDKLELGFHLSDEIMKYKDRDILGLVKDSISKGVINAKNISCEFTKVIKHFSGGDWDLEGMVSFDGAFTSNTIDVDVDTSYLNLTTPAVDIRLNSVLDASSLMKSEGKFHYNMASNSLQAYFPLHQSVILEKNLGLIFSDTNGEVYYDGRTLRFEDVSCETEGLQVEGALEMILAPKEDVLLKIVTSEISGSSDSLQNFLHNIDDLKEIQFPFAGRIHSQEDGFSLLMKFPNEAPFQLDWEAQFSLVQGSMNLPSDFALNDLRFDFSSDSTEQKMVFSNLLGKLVTFGIERDYLLSAKEIEIDYLDKANISSTFDVRLENSMMDLIRIVGGYDGQQRKLFFESDLSHVFGSKFNGAKIELEDFKKIKELECSFSFNTEEIGLASRVIENMGFDSLALSLINSYGSSLAGNIDGRVTLKNDVINARFDAVDIAYEESSHIPVSLELEIKDNIVHLLNSNVGQFGFVGSLLSEDNRYFIDDLVLTTDDHEIKFERGEWLTDKKKWKLPVTSVVIDLGKYFQHGPQLAFGGVFEFNYETVSSPASASFIGGVAFDHLGKDGLSVASKAPIHVEYNKERGFLVKDSIFCLQDGETSLPFDVPTLVFNLEEKMCQGYRIKTPLTNELLEYVALNSSVSKQMKELVVPHSEKAPFDILFDFEYAKEKIQIGGMLPKGIYQWCGTNYNLEAVNFLLNERIAELSGGLNVLDKDFGVNVRIHPYNQFDTVIEVIQLASDENVNEGSKQALYVECKLKDEEGISIDKIDGDLFGFDFHFVPKVEVGVQEDKQIFLGNIKLNLKEMQPILKGDLMMLVEELKLDKGYELSGELKFKQPNFSKPVFDGFFKARDFDLLGYQFKTFFSSIHIDEKGAEVHDIKISDDAVSIDLKEMKLKPVKGDFALEVPDLRIKDLRPSLLMRKGKSRGRIKPFHIKNMVFTDISGMLSDPKSLKGKGSLNFVNTFKQGANLLDVPIEIISRLGLDMGLLVPIQGEMDYTLKDGKLVFTKLKNSHSDNKRSYFFLWNKTESFVDLEGNMHIDIRMKQYVLFKITELFVLSINGTLENPKFSLK